MRFFAYITTFLCFQGEPSGFISKVSILGGLSRRVEVRGSPDTKNKAKRAKEARHGHVWSRTVARPTTGRTQPPRDVARPGRAVWHDRATWHDRAKVAAAGLKSFAIIFFRGHLSIRHFSLAFPLVLGFRERLERVPKNLRLGIEFMLLDCKLWRFDDCSTFKH